MEARRVVCVRGTGAPGSGYVVGPGRVIASAHVTGPVGSLVEVFSPLRPDVVMEGVVGWAGEPGGRDDAAVVLITESDTTVDVSARWGRLVTQQPVTCLTWGSPDGVQRAGAPAEVRQASGEISSGDRLVGNRYTFTVDAHPYASLKTGSPWAGMSGAPVFSANLLIGVVALDPAYAQHGELVVVPAYVLWADQGFRDALGGQQQRLDPIEVASIATIPSGEIGTPSALLLARNEIAPWRSRPELMADLGVWVDQPGSGVWLEHGPAGQGKTRLAAHLGHALPPRWSVWWPDTGADSAAMSTAIHAVAMPMLIVLDYAESRVEHIRAVLEALKPEQEIKVLLLARTCGAWWNELAISDERIADRLTTAVVHGLEGLPELEESAHQDTAYQQAVTAYAARLSTIRGFEHQPWEDMAAALRGGDHAARGDGLVGTGHPLTIQLTALADLLDIAQSANI